jgi:hypothetical protein
MHTGRARDIGHYYWLFDCRRASSTYLHQACPATGEPPGISSAVLVGVTIGLEFGRLGYPGLPRGRVRSGWYDLDLPRPGHAWAIIR